MKKDRTFAPSSPPKKKLFCRKIYGNENIWKNKKKIVNKFSDEYDSNGWSSGSGLKILTNKQMLNRLPILLAQIQARNNSKN